ncbi:hypothetical protein GCM10023222_55130 [Saccharopolyspora cebuensis]
MHRHPTGPGRRGELGLAVRTGVEQLADPQRSGAVRRQRLTDRLRPLDQEGTGLLPAGAAGQLASDDDPGRSLGQRCRPGS